MRVRWLQGGVALLLIAVTISSAASAKAISRSLNDEGQERTYLGSHASFDSLKDTRLPLDARQELGRTCGLAPDG